MLKTLRTVLISPTEDVRPITSGYEVIGAEEDEPIERKKGVDERGVYWSFWALGAGVLLSWNLLICTIPLLASFFPPTSNVKTTLASWLASAYCFGNLTFLGMAQRNVGITSPSIRLHASLLLLLALCLLQTFLLPLLLPHLAPTVLLTLLILLTLLLSLATAYLQASVFALASLWGSPQVLAVMSGQGGIAVLVSVTQVILAVISALNTTGTDGDMEGGQSTLAGVGLWALGAMGAFAFMIAHRRLVIHQDYAIILAPIFARQEHADVAGGDSKDNGLGTMTRRIFRKNWMLEFAVAWVFVVTLSVFPPITTAILSVHTSPPRLLQPAVFIPFHFLVFNVGDYLGRTCPSSLPALIFTSRPRVLLLSLARTLFIPLFLVCNVVPRPPASLPFVNSDLCYLLILLAFGLTNGYISSLSMILSSSPALNPTIAEEEKDIAGTLAAFCLVAGLAGGSVSSFGVNWLIRGNAFG